MIERFARFIEVKGLTECWPWTGCKSESGYGRFAAFGTQKYAPRLMWLFEHGRIPQDMRVLHRCDNPACVNPNHLFLGTHSDNMQDMNRKGRRNDYRGPRPWRKNCPRDQKGRFH